jgi:hypothetical protein
MAAFCDVCNVIGFLLTELVVVVVVIIIIMMQEYDEVHVRSPLHKTKQKLYYIPLLEFSGM